MAFGFTDYLGTEDMNVGNARSRLSFTASTAEHHERHGLAPAGGLSGTVRIDGRKVGRVGVYPRDGDPVSTDYVSVDPSRFADLADQTVDVTVDGQKVGNVTIHGPTGHDPTPTGDGSNLPTPDDSPDTGIDPSNYAGIVNADNEQGIALAPQLRRAGADLGPQGATVTLPDGETVEVGAIEDADEVARVLKGDDAGEVIDADQDAAGGESSGSSNPSSGDTFGAGGAAAAALTLAYMIYRRQ